MPTVRLTKKSVEEAQPEAKDVILWDTELKGFGCKITPKGKRVYFLYYRTSSNTQRRPAIGVHGSLTIQQARKIAEKWLAEVSNGGDPSRSRQESRGAPTIRELAARYLSEHAEVRKKASSIANDKRLLESRIFPAMGSTKVLELTRDDVLRLHQSLRDTPFEANRTLALISKMMNLAELWGFRPQNTNPTRHIPRFKEEKRE